MEYVLPGRVLVAGGWKGYSNKKILILYTLMKITRFHLKDIGGKTTTGIEDTCSTLKRLINVRFRVKDRLKGWILE